MRGAGFRRAGGRQRWLRDWAVAGSPGTGFRSAAVRGFLLGAVAFLELVTFDPPNGWAKMPMPSHGNLQQPQHSMHFPNPADRCDPADGRIRAALHRIVRFAVSTGRRPDSHGGGRRRLSGKTDSIRKREERRLSRSTLLANPRPRGAIDASAGAARYCALFPLERSGRKTPSSRATRQHPAPTEIACGPRCCATPN